MRITLLGHSGFMVEGRDTCLVFDYFTDELNLLETLPFGQKEVVFFVSHGHHDHYNPAIFEYAGYQKVCYVLGKGVNPPIDNAYILAKGQTAEALGVSVRAYGSTDEGVSFLTGFEGKSVFHAGDLNDWYWESESSQTDLKRDEQWFVDEITPLEGVPLDVAFFPTDMRLGRHALKGAMRFALTIRPKLIVPMHLGGGYSLPVELQRRVDEAELKINVAQLMYPGDSISIDQ